MGRDATRVSGGIGQSGASAVAATAGSSAQASIASGGRGPDGGEEEEMPALLHPAASK